MSREPELVRGVTSDIELFDASSVRDCDEVDKLEADDGERGDSGPSAGAIDEFVTVVNEGIVGSRFSEPRRSLCDLLSFSRLESSFSRSLSLSRSLREELRLLLLPERLEEPEEDGESDTTEKDDGCAMLVAEVTGAHQPALKCRFNTSEERDASVSRSGGGKR